MALLNHCFVCDALTGGNYHLNRAFWSNLQQMTRIAWVLMLLKHTIYRNYSQALLRQVED